MASPGVAQFLRRTTMLGAMLTTRAGHDKDELAD